MVDMLVVYLSGVIIVEVFKEYEQFFFLLINLFWCDVVNIYYFFFCLIDFFFKENLFVEIYMIKI